MVRKLPAIAKHVFVMCKEHASGLFSQFSIAENDLFWNLPERDFSLKSGDKIGFLLRNGKPCE